MVCYRPRQRRSFRQRLRDILPPVFPVEVFKKVPQGSPGGLLPFFIAPLFWETRGETSRICMAAERREEMASLKTRSSEGASGVE